MSSLESMLAVANNYPLLTQRDVIQKSNLDRTLIFCISLVNNSRFGQKTVW